MASVAFLLLLASYPCVYASPTGDRHSPLSNSTEPWFAEDAKNIIVVAEGDTASMTCVVENLGKHRLGWVNLDGGIALALQVIIKDPRVSVHHSNNRSWTLEIKDVRLEDSGPYTCQLDTHVAIQQTRTLRVTDSYDDKGNKRTVTTESISKIYEHTGAETKQGITKPEDVTTKPEFEINPESLTISSQSIMRDSEHTTYSSTLILNKDENKNSDHTTDMLDNGTYKNDRIMPIAINSNEVKFKSEKPQTYPHHVRSNFEHTSINTYLDKDESEYTTISRVQTVEIPTIATTRLDHIMNTSELVIRNSDHILSNSEQPTVTYKDTVIDNLKPTMNSLDHITGELVQQINKSDSISKELEHTLIDTSSHAIVNSYLAIYSSEPNNTYLNIKTANFEHGIVNSSNTLGKTQHDTTHSDLAIDKVETPTTNSDIAASVSELNRKKSEIVYGTFVHDIINFDSELDTSKHYTANEDLVTDKDEHDASNSDIATGRSEQDTSNTDFAIGTSNF